MTKFMIGATEWPGISKLIEECGEVCQVAGKLLGTNGEAKHFSGLDLRAALEEEMADVLAAIAFVTKHCNLNADGIELRRLAKIATFEGWHAGELAKSMAPRSLPHRLEGSDDNQPYRQLFIVDPETCDHGVAFDIDAARAIKMDPDRSRLSIVRARWPRLDGPCPKGCGFTGIAYASTAHYVWGDW